LAEELLLVSSEPQWPQCAKVGARVEISRVRVNRMYFIVIFLLGRSEESTSLFLGLAEHVSKKIDELLIRYYLEI
jgi:hypothetical protein